MDYVEIGWGIKCGGEYFPHKVIKMAKGKWLLMTECWNEKWLLSEKEQQRIKERKKKQRKKVRIVFETMLYNSFFLTISKTHKS